MKDNNEHRNEERLPGESRAVPERQDAEVWEQIDQLAGLLAESDLSEIELKQDDRVIRLSRRRTTVYPEAVIYPSAGQAAAVRPLPGGEAAPAAGTEEGLLQIAAPMTGVFYASPSPDDPPFVRPGDIVDPGDTVCLLEAMKIFNELTSDVHGKVVRVVAANGELVKSGQALILLEPV